MNQLVTMDRATGEVVEQTTSLEIFNVPSTAEEMVFAANASQCAAFGHHWRTAAMVYAWTYETKGGRPSKTSTKVERFSLVEFSKLGIRGLTHQVTVAKYREAMQRAIGEQLCATPKIGESIALPAVDFYSDKKSLAANYSSESNEWYTPEEYLVSVRAVLGQIDLDPASCKKANQTVGAKTIFTEEEDGLDREWFGRVFMNPPYGTTEDRESRAGVFCRKAISEYEAGRVSECIILVNSVHSQIWQRPLYRFPVCFVHHRIEFVNQHGDTNPNPTFGNIFVYLGGNPARFAEEFSIHGYCMEPIL